MTLALFGGTFDPIHLGHLLMAESAHQALGLRRVVFVPSGRPPHKEKAFASSAQRLAMVRLAVRGNPHFSISDWEIKQQRVVYTCETLAHFQAQHPREKIAFVIGSDSLIDLPEWRNAQAMLRRYSFVVVERPDFSWRQVPSGLRRHVRRVPSMMVPFASHEIRNSVRQRQSIRYQVPDLVERYIDRHHLYRA